MLVDFLPVFKNAFGSKVESIVPVLLPNYMVLNQTARALSTHLRKIYQNIVGRQKEEVDVDGEIWS